MPLPPETTKILLATLSKSLKLTATRKFLQGGKQVYTHLIKLGFHNELSFQNQILNVYVKCKKFHDAYKLFDEMTVRNLVTWNTVICGLVDCGSDYQPSLYMGFTFFKRMMLDKVGFDPITLNGLFRACLELNRVDIGRQMHCLVLKNGYELSCFISSALVDLYGKCGLIIEARCVFDRVLYKDLVLWNVMLSCYAFNSLAVEALGVFQLMQLENLTGDGFTFSSLLNSCAILGSWGLGEQIHCLVFKLSFDLDVLVASGLVHMYAKNENVDDARMVFDAMAVKNVVSWNTMVVAYGHQGDDKEAIKLLKEMLREDFAPDELTLASVLSSCGNASADFEIMQVHIYVVKFGFQSFLSIGNAMINAYFKCGRTASALASFGSVSEPNLVTWTSLISGYAFSSFPEDSIAMFEKMLSAGISPDSIAFLGVLSACSHAGLIKKGLHYFGLMVKHYHIFPNVEHYACLIDLLGRAGLLDEAFNLLTSMPIDHRADTFGAFIGACKIHRNVELAELASKKLLELEPNNTVNYVMLSNIYAYEARWHDAASMRKRIKNKCDYKVPGCSWTELHGAVHMFVSGDKCHPPASEMYCMLRILWWQMDVSIEC
ncbi:pentatricopeptide repeat-containing protein At2g46050, mitochondrial [Mercurialis annua]|uniref:pentatricopeptide repeat-containing protein At2g46050, mitochondrial n=1 Tax=Mercurialis annua TaxID=3986 RepID=UPI00215EFAE0|nr:pentatricopeptide repeat-containing protein At2g46050, mitochondrial [Mercurialis annua]